MSLSGNQLLNSLLVPYIFKSTRVYPFPIAVFLFSFDRQLPLTVNGAFQRVRYPWRIDSVCQHPDQDVSDPPIAAVMQR